MKKLIPRQFSNLFAKNKQTAHQLGDRFVNHWCSINSQVLTWVYREKCVSRSPSFNTNRTQTSKSLVFGSFLGLLGLFKRVEGLFWGLFVTILKGRSPILGPSGLFCRVGSLFWGLLGLSTGVTGVSWAYQGGSESSHLGPFGPILEGRRPIFGPSGPILEEPEAYFGVFWASCRHIRPILGPFGGLKPILSIAGLFDLFGNLCITHQRLTVFQSLSRRLETYLWAVWGLSSRPKTYLAVWTSIS